VRGKQGRYDKQKVKYGRDEDRDFEDDAPDSAPRVPRHQGLDPRVVVGIACGIVVLLGIMLTAAAIVGGSSSVTERQALVPPIGNQPNQIPVFQAPILADPPVRVEQRAVDRAHRFLSTAERGRAILSYLHFGAADRGHSYKDNLFVYGLNGNIIPGHFALVYQFDWGNDGWTRVKFLCDREGAIYRAEVLETNAGFLNQPFALANLSIQVLGNAIIAAFDQQISPDERRTLQRQVDNADAKGMMEWALRFQQAIGQ